MKMQASDISHLAGQLYNLLNIYERNDNVKDGCVGGLRTVVNLKKKSLNRIITLVSGAQSDLRKHAGEIDKKWEEGVKRGLYKLESLFIETKEFLDLFRIPRSVRDSLIESTTGEAKNILKELNQYSEYESIVIYDASLVGMQLNKEELVDFVMDPRARTVIPILTEEEAGEPPLARLVFDDPQSQNHFSLLSWVSMDGVTKNHQLLSHVVQALAGCADSDSNDKSPFFPIFFKATTEGSKIIITSKGGSASKHLQPLNHDNSWALFKIIALGREGEAQETSPVLLEIGLKIFRKCDNIPFVIKIIASILYTRHTVEEWEHFHDIVWLDYEYKEDDLVAEYGLGSCFSEFLVKGYFLVDNNGGGDSPEGGYKMNYLTYDLMKYVSGHDYSLVDKFTDVVNHEIVRHVSFVVDSSWQAPSWLANAKQLKSLLFRSSKSGELVTVPNIDLSHLRGLRILDFGTVHCENLQYFLGELTNLAYLRLRAVAYKSLPQSITVLRQLKTLNIRHSGVTVLPTYFYESLRQIDVLKVNQNNWFDALALLKYITSIGKLTMAFENAHVQGSLRGHWSGLPNVRDLSLIWSSSYEETRDMDFWVPPSMLRSLAVHFWKGQKVPSTLISKLSNIVSIQIVNCSRCRCLPSFSTLPHLSTLKLWGLNSLEYIEDKPIHPSSPPRHLPKVTSSHIKRDGGDHNAASSALYFRSLKYLILGDLPELKRWSKNENDFQNARQWSFPLLLDFRVNGCPQLRTMPLLPILESLYAINIHGKLLQHLLSSQESPASSSTLKKLHIISIHELDSISIEQLASILKYSLAFLEELEIARCEELDWDVNFNDPVEAWQGLKTLRSLQIENNLKLESLPRGCECFTTLEQLSLSWLYNLQLLPDWLGHLSRLQRLAIQYCSRLKTLPKSLGSLSALQVFEIVYCPRVRELPESFDMLTSLIKLEIRECPKLERRCQKPDGQDWPRIRHIPHVICVELPSPGNPGSYYS
ncbi:hypothetical protein RND81_10G043500 [Saponaria officinalis]|uniref:NB-ARC domain-containing protein n=1 Tax=Saponaria officinalis TaxID=3572 RepID=A0AAW1HY94_SAPOF